MQLLLNGETREFSDEATLTDALDALGMDPLRVATLVNDQVVRRQQRGALVLKEGDRVEAFTFACGG